VIYFIQQGLTGPIKIGYTSRHISNRFREIQNGTPAKLRLIGLIEGSYQDEAALHQYFRRSRLHGEWFEPIQELIDYIYDTYPEVEPVRHGWLYRFIYGTIFGDKIDDEPEPAPVPAPVERPTKAPTAYNSTTQSPYTYNRKTNRLD
jgi:hypothetical protein